MSSRSGASLAAGTQPLGITAADFDGDGDDDLAFANFQSDDVFVALSDGDGRFTPEAGSPIHAGDGVYGIAAADFNGDHRPDLAVSSEYDHLVTIWHRLPSGGFRAGIALPSTASPCGWWPTTSTATDAPTSRSPSTPRVTSRCSTTAPDRHHRAPAGRDQRSDADVRVHRRRSGRDVRVPARQRAVQRLHDAAHHRPDRTRSAHVRRACRGRRDGRSDTRVV